MSTHTHTHCKEGKCNNSYVDYLTIKFLNIASNTVLITGYFIMKRYFDKEKMWVTFPWTKSAK